MKQNDVNTGPDFQNRDEAAKSLLPDESGQQARRDSLLAGAGQTDQAKAASPWSEDARLAWEQTRLRFPAMGLCRR